MKNIIKTWDLWILDNIFQKIADTIWKIAPISCFQLAKAALFFHCLVFFRDNNFLFGAVASIFVLFMNYPAIMYAELNQHRKFANLLRTMGVWSLVRLCCTFNYLLITVIPEYRWSDLYFILYPIFLYFTACQTRPPVERKITEWIFAK
jgi:hypothetical protein